MAGAIVAKWNGVTGHSLPPSDPGDLRSEAAQRVEHLALAEIVNSLKTAGDNHDSLGRGGTATDSDLG